MTYDSSSLTFLGAAETVTGSKYLLEVDGRRVLVDCGLFQGLKELRLRNWAPPLFNPATLDAVVLTHAHLDHCGYLPKLVAMGYRGRIWCTAGTKDLCSIVLPDSAHLQEEDARDANRYRYSKHDPALPLYTQADAARAVSQLQPVGFERPVPIAPGIEVEFINAGHLLGSAFARVTAGGRTILFGGDLGRYGRPILPDPTPVATADVLLLESTYGDRLHEKDDEGAKLAEIVNDTIARGGKVIIPAFALGRVEEVLYWVKCLEEARRIPVLPVYIDSPMAAAALQFYASRGDELDIATPAPAASTAAVPGTSPDRGQNAISVRKTMSTFAAARLVTVTSTQQSADLVASRKPAIVISSSGMATGGRVLHHLLEVLPDARNTVLFVGFQAPGTRGRKLIDGAHEVTLLGRVVSVAARIESLDSMSAHADADEIMRWLSGFERAPRITYLVHGEPVALQALAARLTKQRGWPVAVARYGQRVELP